MMRIRKGFTTLLGITVCLATAACQTTGTTEKDMRAAKIDNALERAAINAAGSGQQSLRYLEKIYKRNSDDPKAALQYAASLREEDYLNRAAAVLRPFANSAETPAALKTEMAAVKLALGEYNSAEDYAKKAILQDKNDYRAYHFLGIALDAKEMYPEAERAYRKGLEHWQGDPTAIMNNLALNLTTQGYLDEASEILQKAKTISPNRPEVERNLRIVNALLQTKGIKAPKPPEKPET